MRNREMPWNTKMTNRNIRAYLIDACGGGLCKKHGEYIGTGKYGLRACPFCDIEEHFKREQEKEKRE